MRKTIARRALSVALCLVLSAVILAPARAAGGLDPYMADTLLSGRVEMLPWEKDGAFLKAQRKSGCGLLMAAYRTVLKDPLPGEEYNVHLAARYICGTVLQPGEVFSQNRKAGPYTPERGYRKGPTYAGTQYIETDGGGVCKVASTLYNVAVMSNLRIVERHNHGMPVPYVPYGQDATVSYGAKDFKFRNDTAHPILIWAAGYGNELYIAFYGQTVPPEVLWSHDVLDVTKAPEIIVKNKSLKPGEKRLAHEGMDGAVVRTQVTLFYPDGTSVIKDMGQKTYKPLPWIYEVGPE
jgi:vancomycin resistance protein VanW